MRGNPERPLANLQALQTLLSVEGHGDLCIVLAEAEKVRPHTYIDVLGDPVQQAEAVVKEFESF